MKFLVTRASYGSIGTGAEKQPCAGAIPEAPDEYGNHRWSIDIADLAALLAFCDAEGEVVLSPPYIGKADDATPDGLDDLPAIKIYDDYIE